MPAGRPPTGMYKVKEMVKTINEYTNNSDLPILKEVCFLNDWCYDYVMQLQRKHQALSQSIKRLLMKKEVNLEKGGLSGIFAKTMTVFSLKQLGWTDKITVSESERSSNGVLPDILEYLKNDKADK